MRTAVLTAPEMVELTTAPDPSPGPGEVLVRMKALGLCGSDLGVWSGARSVPETPWIMGHEGGGEVIAVGEGVDPSRTGEAVVVEPNYPCLTCGACSAGVTSVCPDRGIVGLNMPGLLAELVVVPARFAHRLPPGADDPAMMAVLEPLAVARAAVEAAAVPQGVDVLVTGAGSQGLLVVQLLVAAGAKPWVMELDVARVAHARQLGARDAAEEDAPAEFAHVIDAVGSPGLWQALLPRAAAPVTITVIGMSDKPVPVSTKQITRGRMTIRGTIIYDHPQDFRATIASVAAAELDPREVLTEPIPFSRAGEALMAARTAPGKTWILFE